MGVVNYYGTDGEILGDSQSGDYMRDALGSVTGTSSPTNATVQDTFRYKPYGTALVSSGVSPTPRFQWVGSAGYRQTSISHSRSYVRARHYGQEEGSWTTVDPIWPKEQSYVYVRGKPTSLRDLTGLNSSDPIPFPIFTGRCFRRGCVPPHPCSLPGADPCKFVRQPPPRKDGPVWGRPACCDGKLVPCSWLPPDGERDLISRGCTRVHEQYHIDSVGIGYFCPPCGAHAAVSTLGRKDESGNDIPDSFEECAASVKAGIPCYVAACAAAALIGNVTFESCLQKRKRYLCNECNYAKKHCGISGFPVSDEVAKICKDICGVIL